MENVLDLDLLMSLLKVDDKVEYDLSCVLNVSISFESIILKFKIRIFILFNKKIEQASITKKPACVQLLRKSMLVMNDILNEVRCL
jgi:hypothetical protein